jgi:hypothetical protein
MKQIITASLSFDGKILAACNLLYRQADIVHLRCDYTDAVSFVSLGKYRYTINV